MIDYIWDSIRAGTPDAYNTLFRDYSELMFKYGMKLIGRADIVEEAIQCVFVNLYRQRSRISTPTSVRAYMLGALKNELFGCHHRQMRNLRREMAEGQLDIECKYGFLLELDTESLIAASEAERERSAALQQAIDKLPPRQREAIYLKYYDNLSGPEIAQVMGISHQTTRTTLMNALTNLRKEMKVSVEVLMMILSIYLMR